MANERPSELGKGETQMIANDSHETTMPPERIHVELLTGEAMEAAVVICADDLLALLDDGQYDRTEKHPQVVERLFALVITDHGRLLEQVRNFEAAAVRRQLHDANAEIWEKAVCAKALGALAGAGICTPQETYGVNTSWAVDELSGDAKTATEANEARWQSAIYEVLTNAVPDTDIDGGGCDSGDPLDVTLAEIGQALEYLQEQAASAMPEGIRKALEAVTSTPFQYEAGINETLARTNHERYRETLAALLHEPKGPVQQ